MSTTVKLKAGTLDLVTRELSVGSMARAIDDALALLIPVAPAEDPLGRRKFALAIAQGVINHLNANEAAFVVDVPNVGGATVERTIRVDVE